MANISAGLFSRRGVLLTAMCGVVGCYGSGEPSEPDPASSAPPMPVAAARDDEPQMTASELRMKLKPTGPIDIRKAGGEIRYVNLMNSGVSDISPLKGLPLKFLDLTGLPVDDFSALKGMPLEELYLENTMFTDLRLLEGIPLRILRLEYCAVRDISALKGMPLTQLNLYGTLVTDISAVETMPLNTLWLKETKVSDLSPLKGKSLESLDISDTPVDDLSVLRGMVSLRRLEISGTKVSDLSPLKGLQLTRLVFTPDRITRGIEAVRKMQSLQDIGPSFNMTDRAAEFWKMYDAGEFSKPSSEKPAAHESDPQ